MSSDPFLPNDDFLASYMRVIRGKDSLQQLVDALPTLEQKALSAPSTLTEQERRQLHDFPDVEDEAEYIKQVSTRSREELISTVISNPRILSDDEIALLEHRFWSKLSQEEVSKAFNGTLKGGQEVKDRIFRARGFTFLPNEVQSMSKAAGAESWRRHCQRRDDKQRNWNHLPNIPVWMQDLYQNLEEQNDLTAWGFVAFFDAEAQAMGLEVLENFQKIIEGVLSETMKYNGIYQSLLDRKWKLVMINGPPDVYASLEPNADNSKLRSAFWDLLDEDKEYGVSQLPDDRSAKQILNDSNCKGILTNTFLVINQACVDSIINQRFLDDMRILAFEAEFPQPNKTYIEGYHGRTWVRLEQIIDNFYYERMINTPMDVLWKTAQESKNQAFSSLDPEEAKVWSNSTMLTGPQENSILGRRMRVA